MGALDWSSLLSELVQVVDIYAYAMLQELDADRRQYIDSVMMCHTLERCVAFWHTLSLYVYSEMLSERSRPNWV